MASVLEFLEQIRGGNRLGLKRKRSSLQPSRSIFGKEDPDAPRGQFETDKIDDTEDRYHRWDKDKDGEISAIEERAGKTRDENIRLGALNRGGRKPPPFPTLSDADIRARIIRERLKRAAGVGPGRRALLGTPGGQRGTEPARTARRLETGGRVTRPRTEKRRSLSDRLRI